MVGFDLVNKNWFSLYMSWCKKKEEERQARSQAYLVKRQKEKNDKEAKVQFKNYFYFDPEKLISLQGKKEALLRLAFLANNVRREAEGWANNPSNSAWERSYDQMFNKYENAINILKYHAPVFVEEIPHWTEIVDYIKQWSEGSEKKENSDIIDIL